MAKQKPVVESPDPAGSLTPPEHREPAVQALEPEKCTDLAAAIRACDEKGYPVMVDGTVHEKKVWAIGACEKVLGGPGSPVSGASVVVARPKFV